MMSPALEPMTFDELSELYRVEMRNSAVTSARKDLFRAMANLLTALRQDYDRQMALDPESIMCEGAEQRRKSAERLVKDITRLRTQKITSMALHNATGGRQTLDNLTDEERDYYSQILEITKRHINEVDRLRGKTRTVDTRIDEPHVPVHEDPVQKEEPVTQETVEESEPVQDVPMETMDDVQEMFDDGPIPDEFPEESFDEPMHAEIREPVHEKMEEPVPEKHEVHDEQVSDDLMPILIRVKEDLPEFAGPNRDYKLFKEDLVTLPKVLADVLVNSDKAMVIRPTP